LLKSDSQNVDDGLWRDWTQPRGAALRDAG